MLNYTTLSGDAIATSPQYSLGTQDTITFNGYSLSNANIITNTIDFDDRGGTDLNAYNYPRYDGGGILSRYHRGRDIKMKITLTAVNAQAFATLVDACKQALDRQEGHLEVNVSGEVRRIKATCTAIVFNRQPYHLTFITADVTFRTFEPYMYAKTPQSVSSDALTTNPTTSVTYDLSGGTETAWRALMGASYASSDGGNLVGSITNGKIVASVSSGSLTVALKTTAGADPSSGSPVIVGINGTNYSITSAFNWTIGVTGTDWIALSSGVSTTLYVYMCYSSTP